MYTFKNHTYNRQQVEAQVNMNFPALTDIMKNN